jgi:hypothetical protein
MILGHGRRHKVTSPGHRRARVVRDLGALMVEVMFARSMEHNPRLFRETGPGDPSSGGCEASLVLSLTFQSFGPTSERRPGESDVVEAGSDPVVVL